MITTQRLDLVKVSTKQGFFKGSLKNSSVGGGGEGEFTKRDHSECGEMTNGCW